jgi:hypothetical protein
MAEQKGPEREANRRMKYLVEGRVVPERVDLSFSKGSFSLARSDGVKVKVTAEIIKSKIFVHVDAPVEVSIPDIRNFVFTVVGDMVNYAGFKHVLGISYEIDSITNLTEETSLVFGTEGFVFDDTSEFGNRLTFTTDELGVPNELKDPSYLTNTAVSRATFELRNSIRYPDFTALHCRLAIEAIRNSFDPDDEKNGWQSMREALKVSRPTIESFQDIATLQRHGKNAAQTWPQRRHCMQIAWEVCSRFMVYIVQEPRKPLKSITPSYKIREPMPGISRRARPRWRRSRRAGGGSSRGQALG